MFKKGFDIFRKAFSKLDFPAEKSELIHEEQRRKATLTFFILVAIPTLLSFVIYHLSQGNILRSALLFFIGLALAASLIYLRYDKKPVAVFRVFVGILGCYFLFTMISGGAYGSRIFWPLVLPLISFFLLGRKEGLLWSVVIFFLCTYAFLDPGSIIGTYPYEKDVISRFLVTFGLIVLIAHITESISLRYREGMENEQAKLRSEIKERMLVEEELKKHRLHLEELIASRTSQLVIANKILKQEIEERKQTEAALRESEERYRRVVEFSFDGIAIHSKGKIVFVNSAGAKLLGSESPEHLRGKDLMDFVHPDFHHIVEKRIDNLTDKEVGAALIEEKFLRLDGTELDVEAAGIGITYKGKAAIQVVFRDISKRKQSEEALRQSEERYRSLFENTGTATFVMNDDMTISQVNTRFEDLSGYRREDIIGRMKTTDFAPPQEQALVRDHHHEMRNRKDVSHYEYEFEFLDGQGNTRTVFIQVGTVPGTQQNVASIIDISPLKSAEKALRESEEKYRTLVENAHDAIVIAKDGILKYANRRTEKLTGYSAEKLTDMPFAEFIHPDDRDVVLERHTKRLKGETLPSTYKFKAVNSQGEVLPVELSTVLIEWEGGTATLNIIRDISEQKKIEEQLMQAQKMESIGTLAGGIAHDFNNLLMAIQGNVSLMILETDPHHPHYERLKNIEDQIRSGADLNKQLLGFARGGKYKVSPTDLNSLIRKSSEMFSRAKKEIHIHSKYQNDIWTVEADQGQIEQVLLNLYVNAWHSMPEGGRLYIQTQNIELDEKYVLPFKLKPGKYVKVSVTDTGIGMDKNTKERIFDPFFTTRSMGRGTGLGLASAYGIIKNHEGIINVYSEKGQGATFNIYLPASEKAVKKDTKESSSSVLPGTETVLLIDDEPTIIGLAKEMLENLGYHVLAAKSGLEAIEIYVNNQRRIDVVLLDMIMPEMGGGETYDRLKEMNPEIRVLLSSGYSLNGAAQKIMKRGCDGFIQKPYNLKELSHKLRQILDKR